jgi:AmmeMemoRadiSam system protein B
MESQLKELEADPGSDAMTRPRLRPGIGIVADKSDGRHIYLWDQLRLGNRPERLNALEFFCIQLFDGKHNLRDVQSEAMRRVGGTFLPLEWFTALVERLEQALMLDGPRFQARLRSPVREPSCIGTYEAEPAALRRQLSELFTGPGGPGLPRPRAPDGQLRAALIPHIDYLRGGRTFAWGFREVVERTDASLFVIIGTSHYSVHRFTLTRKDFKTPLGIARTDQAYIDRLASHYGDGLFDDEMAHLPEHSIELEVVLLQYLYEERWPFRIVPLLVGPFSDCLADGSTAPSTRPDIRRMIKALRRAEQETNEPICYIISGDLAHLGPKFGDPEPIAEPFLARSRAQDQALLSRVEAADSEGFYNVINGEADRRRICGFPPTYVTLEAARPSKGKLLHYDRYFHPRGFESVSFASVALYR